MDWVKASKNMTDFNGLRMSVVIERHEIGIFKERHVAAFHQWAVRYRPLDKAGQPTDCWGHAARAYPTMAQAVASVELHDAINNKDVAA